ncbi:phosphatase PAP2 family protein [Methylomonas sp. HW2-6]|uniref:phosphatase PAP2 family protein n=1 Tax=Methylomonas TaxID=416 RepID=UPI00112DCE09|nr:phosphatase PAP2 family protein [Methylomonas koyamae]TPQ29916.1 phosphoesterase PA-phosphatase [Methylomonas koyamae]
MLHRTIRRARRELAILLILAGLTTLPFWFSDLDLRLAGLFYRPDSIGDVWPYQHWGLWEVLYDYAFPFTVCAGTIALIVYIASHFHAYTRRFRLRALYILLVIAIGPGLVVNLIFKDHWGRARPVHVTQFGGEHQYTPPLKFGHTPDKSFVCGHCSVGYSFFVLYFLSQNHKLLYFGLTLTLAWTLGFTRMTSGGHFVSDILWSGYLVFLVAYALYYGWYVRVAKLHLRPER